MHEYFEEFVALSLFRGKFHDAHTSWPIHIHNIGFTAVGGRG